MGNCAQNPRSQSAPETAAKKISPIVRLYGSESCPITCRIRVALLYKTVPIQFVPSENPILGKPILLCGSDTVTGPAESVLSYIDARFAGAPALLSPEVAAEGSAAAAVAATLQHRSLGRHVEGMVRWAESLVATRGGGGRGRMEVRRLSRFYEQLVEVLMEHAQMEERIVFPALERADRGICKVANEEHARDLPMMNGIKEEIKTLVVLETGTQIYQEALLNLSLRSKTLQEHCKEHFAEEERELLPLLETVEGGEEEGEVSWMEQVMGVMESTHSQLFPFFMAGLTPQEAMHYVHLLSTCTRDQKRVVTMLRSLIASKEGAPTPLVLSNKSPLKCQYIS